MLCEERFFEIYNRDAEGLSFAPYRICPIGAHVDHNLGKITGLAIDKGIHIAFRPKHNGDLGAGKALSAFIGAVRGD